MKKWVLLIIFLGSFSCKQEYDCQANSSNMVAWVCKDGYRVNLSGLSGFVNLATLGTACYSHGGIAKYVCK